MSEEILKALTQLFAIITKQDGGVSEKERDFVIGFFEQDLDAESVKEYLELYDKFAGFDKDKPVDKTVEVKKERKLTSVRDSVKTLAICKKINKTLTQKQKVVVLIKILELVGSDKKFTPQRMEIIDTVSTVFNIVKDEYKLIESFVLGESSAKISFEDTLTVSRELEPEDKSKHVYSDINGEIIFLMVRSVEMYFVKYLGDDDIVLNGFLVKNNHVYQFSHGSTIKTPTGDALYYSELIRNFITGVTETKLSFNAKDIEFTFPNGGIGLRDINIAEGPGKLIGIMGASGAGKTTLLNVLAGINEPSNGEILINNININTDKESIEGVIGYVSQDDLLIEELTVYQNLYYNGKLCFKDISEEDLHKKVMEVLTSLGLEQRKDLKVGSVLDKTISGGQRKRLNIALELIREPAVMFVDEPTSGLSSRDSENVIDLLKELSLKGKLIFVVIHQPSSDIYKMFDKMYIMDTGGYPIYYGHPVEAVTYFKRATKQVDSERGQCPDCGNVNPEQIFNIIEAKVVDEYGELTNKRKMNPTQWYDRYLEKFNILAVADEKELPPKTLNIPSKLKQIRIFMTRDLLSKITDKQYMLINLLEAPLLALILAFIIRYKNDPANSEYIYRFNDNLPAYMMMSIVVALFMGLSISAEEIISDRKILKRESFLNLSWNSYLFSKLAILFMISAIQTFTFVLIGNLLLEINGQWLTYWIVLFTVSCFGNMLGLNISSAFRSAITVYVLIPILLIPQMILSGLLFPFDKLNDIISTKGEVPVIADVMASRWAFEALAVNQFKSNDYEKKFYDYERVEKQADFKSAYLIPKLKEKLDFVTVHMGSKDDSIRKQSEYELRIIRHEIELDTFRTGLENIDLDKDLMVDNLNKPTVSAVKAYYEGLNKHYLDIYKKAEETITKLTFFYENKKEFNLNDNKNTYYNESLSDMVKNITVKDRIIEYNGKLIQQINPIYSINRNPKHALDYRTHFYAPEKHLFNKYFPTFVFNMLVIWSMSFILYFTLYFELLKRLLNIFSK